jgi:geranylgeranyl pyrophosphate synthase
VANKHPLLSVMARYYFQVPGKRFRPTVVLLMGRATGGEAGTSPRHIQLAEIVEMIHTASLAHDDVLDEAVERRGRPAINAQFGNKFAVLVGDFLLARASVSLADLKDHTVTGLLSNMIAELVEGEFVQMRPQSLSMEVYLRKTYLKTASMLRNAARAAAVLSDPGNALAIETASAYGEALGMAFQIVDDVLDVTSSATGKAQNADLAAGIVTAPLLFASESRPELLPLFARGFGGEGDRSVALRVLGETDGVARAMALAASYCESARFVLARLPASHSRSVLDHLAQKVLTRKH